MSLLWALLFVSAILVFWSLNLLGLPGNWMIVAAAAFYVWLISENGGSALRWTAVAIVAGLAIIGEVVELGASATGVRKVGGSRNGAVAALIGSVVGAMTGLFVGVPIPVVGSVVAALLFAGFGAFLGAMFGEFTTGKSLAASLKIGHAAFWGRLFGTFAKVMIGTVMAGVAIALVFV